MAVSLAQSHGSELRDAFESLLQQAIPDIGINGATAPRLPNTSNILVPGTQAEGMMILLDQKHIHVSAGSACHAGALHPSHVLEAMGLDVAEARSCLRISFSRMNQFAEIEPTVAAITAAAHKMRSLLGS